MEKHYFDSVTAIVPAGPEHLQGIAQLARKIWMDHYPGIISVDQINYMLERDYADQVLLRSLENGTFFYRLLIEDNLRGFAAWSRTPVPGEGKLHKIYLDVSLHGKGLGSRLLRHVENACGKQQIERLILQVNRQNHKAIAAYQGNGYQVETACVVDIGQGFVMDDYLMAKHLSPVY